MPQTQHTAGPWTAEAMRTNFHHVACEYQIRAGADSATVATVYPYEVRPDEAVANARLIEAAPGLLEALRDAVAVMQQLGAQSGNEYQRRSLAAGRASLAKATE